MIEHPLILQGWGVRTTFDGRKTMTRRIPGIANSTVGGRRVSAKRWANLDFSKAWIDPSGSIYGPGPYLKVPTLNGETTHRVRCLYEPGDVLWVRESWRQGYPKTSFSDGIIYRADKARALGMDEYSNRHRWKPSIHMPRWACRLTLTVVDIRVERVQEISVEDQIAEGLSTQLREHDAVCDLHDRWISVWDSINAKRGYSWESNPWVWVIEYRKREGDE